MTIFNASNLGSIHFAKNWNDLKKYFPKNITCIAFKNG